MTLAVHHTSDCFCGSTGLLSQSVEEQEQEQERARFSRRHHPPSQGYRLRVLLFRLALGEMADRTACASGGSSYG